MPGDEAGSGAPERDAGAETADAATPLVPDGGDPERVLAILLSDEVGESSTHRFTPRDRLELRMLKGGEIVIGTVEELEVEAGTGVIRLFLNSAGDDPAPWWFAVYECFDDRGDGVEGRMIQLEVESAAVEHCARDLTIEVRLESVADGEYPAIRAPDPPGRGNG